MIGFIRGLGAASPSIGRVYRQEIKRKGVAPFGAS